MQKGGAVMEMDLNTANGIAFLLVTWQMYRDMGTRGGKLEPITTYLMAVVILTILLIPFVIVAEL
jgi:hypothetical protein